VSSKEIKSKARVRTKTDIPSTKIKTLGSSAARLGVDDQGGEVRGKGKGTRAREGTLKGKSLREKKEKRKHALEAVS
jgi:hypothetical protein